MILGKDTRMYLHTFSDPVVIPRDAQETCVVGIVFIYKVILDRKSV